MTWGLRGRSAMGGFRYFGLQVLRWLKVTKYHSHRGLGEVCSQWGTPIFVGLLRILSWRWWICLEWWNSWGKDAKTYFAFRKLFRRSRPHKKFLSQYSMLFHDCDNKIVLQFYTSMWNCGTIRSFHTSQDVFFAIGYSSVKYITGTCLHHHS